MPVSGDRDRAKGMPWAATRYCTPPALRSVAVNALRTQQPGRHDPVATLACYDWVKAGRNAEEGIVADVVSTLIEENIRAAFAEAEKETAFWREQYDTYLARYPDQFVAVSRADRRVVVASANLDYLLGFIAGQGLDVQQVWLKFIAATPQHVTL